MNNRQVNIKTVGIVAPYYVYRIRIDEYVYIGHTKDVNKRISHHLSDKGRIVFKTFNQSTCDMEVIVMCGANNKSHAMSIEKELIQRACKVYGDKLLNTHHAQSKQ